MGENYMEENTFFKPQTRVQPSKSKLSQFSPWRPWEGIWTSSKDLRPAVTDIEEVYYEPAAAASVLPAATETPAMKPRVESEPAVAHNTPCTPAAAGKGMCGGTPWSPHLRAWRLCGHQRFIENFGRYKNFEITS